MLDVGAWSFHFSLFTFHFSRITHHVSSFFLLHSPFYFLSLMRSATVSPYARAVLAGGTAIAIGILWDISWHRTIGRDTFWTPAHLAISLGGLLGGCTCGWLVIRTTFFATPAEQ